MELVVLLQLLLNELCSFSSMLQQHERVVKIMSTLTDV